MEENHQTLPEKRYERSMNHNYMILSSYDFFGQGEQEDYTTRMLLENNIPGLLPVLCRKNAGERQYCYEINSMQSLDRLYEKQEIGYDALHKLLMGCIRILECLEEYLLDGTQIVLSPEYIYLHMETNEPFLVCYPEYQADIRESFKVFIDYLLTRIDHTQEQTVWLAYQVYRYTRNPNYVLSQIKELLYEAEEMTKTPVQNKEELQMEQHTEHYRYKEEVEEPVLEEPKNEKEPKKEKEKRKNIWGGLLCILLVFGAAGILAGDRFLHLIPLSQRQEVSLYGAMGMAAAATAIFFASLVKQWKQETQREELSIDTEDEIEYWESAQSSNVDKSSHVLQEEPMMEQTTILTGATVLLNQEVARERFLRGKVNGEEVCIPLKNFPLTIGKLAGAADFVIHDSTVSRMHARLEQKNGQIYICDLNSTNGTIRNGTMLTINEEVELEPGDEIMFGRVCFTYC